MNLAVELRFRDDVPENSSTWHLDGLMVSLQFAVAPIRAETFKMPILTCSLCGVNLAENYDPVSKENQGWIFWCTRAIEKENDQGLVIFSRCDACYKHYGVPEQPGSPMARKSIEYFAGRHTEPDRAVLLHQISNSDWDPAVRAKLKDFLATIRTMKPSRYANAK